jgi:hypothetical protein
MNLSTTLPDNSVIIKLNIIGNNPVETKILIQINVIYIQAPGMFQAVCRMFSSSNPTDLHYMYNPITLIPQNRSHVNGFENTITTIFILLLYLLTK